jgi:two-component system OmpR family sensor kinase
MSLRRRLALLTVVAFAWGLLAIGLVVPRLVRNFLTDRLDNDLRDAVAIAARLDGPYPTGGPGSNRFAIYVERRDANGNVLALFDPVEADGGHPPALPDDFDDVKLGTPFTVGSDGGGGHWRAVVLRGPGDLTNRTAVAIPANDVEDTVAQIVRIEIITSIVALVALGFLAWLLTGVGLRPLRRMQRSAAAITGEGDLSRRVEHPSPKTELGELGVTLNEMLGRIETSFAAQQETETKLRRVVADASHELRTPLTSIRGYAELYRRGGSGPEQVERSMTRIEQESERMGHMVDDLLSLARHDEGAPMEIGPVDLSPIVHSLADDLRVVQPERPITVAAVPLTVEGDAGRIFQAVSNLAVNARVHTPPTAAIELAVGATTLDGAPAARIAVIDHGPGLTPEQMEKVFDRFYRADVSRSRQQGGSGLGLSIAAAVVEAHQGTIGCAPTPGGGATFEITLPLAHRRGLAPPKPTDEPAAAPEPAVAAGET